MITDEELRQVYMKIVDLPDVIDGLLRQSSKVNKNYRIDGRIQTQILRGQAPRFWAGAPKAGCSRCMALFNDYDVIPKYCFDCYKITIEPRSVAELFKLLLVFERINLPQDNTRKCIVDNKISSSVIYKGRVYCRGLQEAKENHHLVREAVFDNISPDIKIGIQHGCAEYPDKYPEYAKIDSGDDELKYDSNWQFYEDIVDRYWIFGGQVDTYDKDGKGTDPLRELFALQFWLRLAATRGDMSYLILTGGRILKPLSTIT